MRDVVFFARLRERNRNVPRRFVRTAIFARAPTTEGGSSERRGYIRLYIRREGRRFGGIDRLRVSFSTTIAWEQKFEIGPLDIAVPIRIIKYL